jgi:isovaleryl-CoA dehydrogenase
MIRMSNDGVSPSINFQDCAGAILYATEKAVEVALEGMQCLGGNGYINGEFRSDVIYNVDKRGITCKQIIQWVVSSGILACTLSEPAVKKFVEC